MQITYQYGYDDGTVNIEKESNTEIIVFKTTKHNGASHQRGTSFRAVNKEQADRWYKLLTDNPDFAKQLIF